MTLFPNGGMDVLITVKDKEYRKQFENYLLFSDG